MFIVKMSYRVILSELCFLTGPCCDREGAQGNPCQELQALGHGHLHDRQNDHQGMLFFSKIHFTGFSIFMLMKVDFCVFKYSESTVPTSNGT